jgi:hypothetical protein
MHKDLLDKFTSDIDILNLFWDNVFTLAKLKYMFLTIDDS